MGRPVDDPVCVSLFDDLARVEDDDAVRDLGEDGQVVRDKERRHPLPLDDGFEGLEHLDLRGDVKKAGGLVQEQQVRLGAKRHGRHQPLQLAARHLVRIAAAEPVGVGQFQDPVKFHRPFPGLFAAHPAVEHGRLGHLFPHGKRRVEGGGGASER